MSHIVLHMTVATPRRAWGLSSQEGPVLLATKPFNGFEAPLLVARWLATREERALRVISVLERTDAAALASAATPLPAKESEREALAAQIRRELTPLGAEPGATQIVVVEGPCSRNVVDAARACDARVIVIGTGKHNPIGRYLYGERALQIVSIADRPVLVVPDDARADAVDVAVVAVDFSPASVRAARAVLPMLSHGGRLILVHVRTEVTLREENAEEWNDAYARRCATLFAQFQRQLQQTLSGVSVETKVLRGDAVRTILDYATACHAGLIACGRLGHSLMARVFVGSVSSALVRQARCPVLVAPQLPGDTLAHEAGLA
ncbi:MAG: universal stress protein [bacterium]